MRTVRRWTTTEPMTRLPPLHGPQRLGAGTGVSRATANGCSPPIAGAKLCCWPYAEKEAKPLWKIAQAHDGWIRQLAVSPDGKLLASCGSDRQVRLWSAENGQKLRELPDHKLDSVLLLFTRTGRWYRRPQGHHRAVGAGDGQVRSSTGRRPIHHYDRIQDVGGVRCFGFDRPARAVALWRLSAGKRPSSRGTPAARL